MKNMKSKYYMIIWIVLSILISSCSNQQSADAKIDLKGMKAPTVKEPVLTLKMPSPPQANKDSISEVIRDTSRFNYLVSVDKKAIKKDSTKGMITESNSGKFLISTKQGQSINLSYFLPGNNQLMISKEDSVTIFSNDEIKGASMNRRLSVESSKGVIISSGIQTNNSPIKITMGKNMVLQQGEYNEKSIISDSKYDTQYSAPVYLISNNQKKLIEQKKDFTFTNNNQKYLLKVYLSSYEMPKKEFVSVSEGQGYFIDYYLIMLK
jgi:hypothetical protein